MPPADQERGNMEQCVGRFSSMCSFRRSLLAVVVGVFCLGLVPPTPAQVSDPPADTHYQAARLVDVQKRVQRDPRMWEWDIPVVFTEVETFRMQLEVDGKTYIADYTPNVQPGYFPAGWRSGSEIDVRTEGRKLFLKLPGNGELAANIIKREGK
jgi:hypothetical protein